MISGKQVGGVLLVLSALAICIATLTPVSGLQTISTTAICVICGDRGLADFLANIVLFAPLGFAIALRGGPIAYAAGIGFLFSGAIEALQIGVIAGRDTSVGDVVANTLGAVVGWSLGRSRAWWQPRPGRSAVPAFALTALALFGLLAGLFLFEPAPPDAVYFVQWTPALGGDLAHYDGEIREAHLGPLTFTGPGRIEDSESLRALLRRPVWDITFIAGGAPDRLAPIVSIYDAGRREIMLLGADGTDLVYRNHMRAAVARLDGADLRVPEAFAAVQPGDSVRLRFVADAAGYCITVNGRQRCGRGFTVGDTWSLLLYPYGWGATARFAMSVLSLSMLFVPVGFLMVRLRALAAAIALAVLVLLIGPPLLGFAITPPFQILAVCGGLVLGSGLSWIVARPRHGEVRK